jgi:hypothetical protein
MFLTKTRGAGGAQTSVRFRARWRELGLKGKNLEQAQQRGRVSA